MYNLVLIVQLFNGGTAFEYDPFPDADVCETYAEKPIVEIKKKYDVLAVFSDCRELYPELSTRDSKITISGVDE
jgi:hypothetical protein